MLLMYGMNIEYLLVWTNEKMSRVIDNTMYKSMKVHMYMEERWWKN